MYRPQVIFLDAVGTLFNVQGSVGQVYASLAQTHGVKTDSDQLNEAFFETFKAAPAIAFPGSEPTQIPAQEYAWWYAIAEGTFSAVGAHHQFDDFEGFFADLYAHFATAAPWFVYDDAYSFLACWQDQGIQLGLISNFDSRIYAVLEALDLKHFFQSITIASEVGSAKPESGIFATALKKHGCTADEAWHIGDSYRDDFKGARAAGIKGIWLQRPA